KRTTGRPKRRSLTAATSPRPGDAAMALTPLVPPATASRSPVCFRTAGRLSAGLSAVTLLGVADPRLFPLRSQGMTDERRLSELLQRWQQGLAQGREEPVEGLCRDHPDLADELRRRIDILRGMADLVRSLNGGATVAIPPAQLGTPTIPGYEV